MRHSHGLVLLEDYLKLDDLPLYRQLEKFSDRFVATHRDLLRSYARGWVADPFRQWSRRWEYPWVASHLQGGRVLDAGSGLTFFPFYLAEEGAEVHCLDQDRRLENSFARISAPRVHFQTGSLQKLPYADRFFDAIYCISVLEHTGAFAEIAAEFRRVLKPGGSAFMTFDICLNGMADLSPEASRHMLRQLQKHFVITNPPELRDFTGVLDTAWIRQHRPGDLPWRYPRLSALKAGVLRGAWPRFIRLTVCTLVMSRR